ncbi:MAG: DUF4240 domain-containing protein [Bacteroidetes bacterium]|nr:DUF4240 domain-containing protein [Bacteroidota bacterium]
MSFFSNLFGGGNKSNNSNKRPAPTAELMPEDQFWKIIQSSFDAAGGDYERQQETLAEILRKTSLKDIVLYFNRFNQLRGLAYQWPLWGAAYIIGGGCSDDGFEYFRTWLIAQGKERYYKALSNPDSLAEVDEEHIAEVEWEGIAYVANDVYQELTDEEVDADSEFIENQEVTGKEWTEEGDDLKQMFPLLWEKYSR